MVFLTRGWKGRGQRGRQGTECWSSDHAPHNDMLMLGRELWSLLQVEKQCGNPSAVPARPCLWQTLHKPWSLRPFPFPQQCCFHLHSVKWVSSPSTHRLLLCPQETNSITVYASVTLPESWHQRPNKGIFWRKMEKPKWTLNLAAGPKFPLTDMLHVCTLLRSTPLWCFFHIHLWNEQGSEASQEFSLLCSGHRRRTERYLITAFHLCVVADEMDSNVSSDFGHLALGWNWIIKIRLKARTSEYLSHTLDHQSQSLEEFTFWLSLLCSGSWSW